MLTIFLCALTGAFFVWAALSFLFFVRPLSFLFVWAAWFSFLFGSPCSRFFDWEHLGFFLRREFCCGLGGGVGNLISRDTRAHKCAYTQHKEARLIDPQNLSIWGLSVVVSIFMGILARMVALFKLGWKVVRGSFRV